MSKIVKFDQAVQLKKLGYNKGSYNFYLFDKAKETEDSLTEHGKFDNWNLLDHLNLHIGYATAPTVSEALDFIREKRIYCGVYPFMWGYKGMAIVQDRHNPCTIEVEPLGTHPLASSALLDAVLTYLEERTDV